MTNISAAGDGLATSSKKRPAYAADVSDVFRDQHERLLRIAFLLSGDHGVAEEVVADAFVKAYPLLARGRVDDPPAYLRRAVINGLRRRWRRRQRERQAQDRQLRILSTSFEDGSLERQRLIDALGSLSPRQRAAVVLRFFDDRSEAQTAALLGISAGAVKTHTHRALAQLRTTLQEDL